MTTFEATTLLIAGYAAILSTINLILRINDSRRKLRVEIAFGFTASSPGLKLFLKAINDGKDAIGLNGCVVHIEENDRDIAIVRPEGENQLPYSLKPHDSTSLWIDFEEVREDLKTIVGDRYCNIRGVFTTKTGQKVSSKKMKVDLQIDTRRK